MASEAATRAPRRYRTPAGIRVDVISLTLTGGPGNPHSRDGGIGGDGQWITVTAPSGVALGQVRTVEELAGLGASLPQWSFGLADLTAETRRSTR